MKNPLFYLVFILLVSLQASPVFAAWSADWSTQQKITIDTSAIKEPLTDVPVLVRLHSGNFDFTTANIDGSDLRFIAADDKTELKFYLEKYDAANELAIAWVVLPTLSADSKLSTFTLYSGNEAATSTSNVAVLQPPALLARFPFAEASLLKDESAAQLHAEGTLNAQKAGLIGESAVLTGAPLRLNLPHPPTDTFTWSTWFKPATLPQNGNLFKLGTLTLAVAGDQLVLQAGNATANSPAIIASQWQHVAVVVEAGQATLYVNGQAVAPIAVGNLSASNALEVAAGVQGELDELQLTSAKQSAASMLFIAKTQGAEANLVTVTPAGEEAAEGGEANYMSILINSLTLDAKVVIAILAVMFAISAWVMVSKGLLVGRTDKDNALFLSRFQQSSATDLLNLDQGNQFQNSTLYGLYQAGLREIKKREIDGKIALGGASIDAIKAAVDADLVRETQRMNSLMVLLTIAISGGPFLGLLGTVVGVMITFAAIAAAGDVNVNAIAPGIAAALLATVAGLGVAIPALFGYNYLASRIKNITIAMQIFVDEFITRTAELYGKE